MDLNKIQDLNDKIIKLLNKAGLNALEYTELIGRLQFIIGASLAGYKTNQTPDLKFIHELYIQSPTLDLAMILAAATVLEWTETYKDNPTSSSAATLQMHNNKVDVIKEE